MARHDSKVGMVKSLERIQERAALLISDLKDMRALPSEREHTMIDRDLTTMDILMDQAIQYLYEARQVRNAEAKEEGSE